jgi:hypothetical protein
MLSGSIQLDAVQPGPPSKARVYLSSATALLPGATKLYSDPAASDDGYILLAGFIAELLLKSYISSLAPATKLTSTSIRHNLEGLWNEAANARSSISGDPPEWVMQLHAFHNGPDFFIRYKTGGGIYSLPSRASVQAGLCKLRDIVEEKVGAS